MSATLPTPPPARPKSLPTHLELPDTDGLPVINCAEHRQSELLTSSLRPILRQLHPDDRYFIGEDNGIYWRITDPPLAGCKSPDWYYVPGVSKEIADHPYRRSYVLWQERVPPAVLIEYVSDDKKTEWDRTPNVGKFWVYDQVFEASFYAIHDHATGVLEVFHRADGRLERMTPNARGRFPVEAFGVELGTVRERLDGFLLDWLRWFDRDGNLLPSSEEQISRLRLEREQDEKRERETLDRLAQTEELARRLADKLGRAGIDPNRI